MINCWRGVSELGGMCRRTSGDESGEDGGVRVGGDGMGGDRNRGGEVRGGEGIDDGGGGSGRQGWARG